ncbi:hypothetical protein ACTWP5_27340, partial [Streptomyces sp. 4N509B]
DAVGQGRRARAGRVGLWQRPYRVAETVVPGPPRHVGDPEPPGQLGTTAARTAALDEAAVFFAASIERHGGRHARGSLAAYLADEVAPLLTVRHAPRHQRELLVAASRLAFLLARMYEDGQRHGAAQRYYGFAHRLAGESGDLATWSVVLRAMSAQAQRLGHLPAALQLARAAAGSADEVPPAQRSYVQAQLAAVLAATGDRRGALSALARAERAAERATAPRGPAPFDRYPPAALLFQTSGVLLDLGDPSGALAALGQAAGERAPSDLRGQALTQARRGELLLRTGRPEEACGAWDAFLTARDHLRSGEADRAVRQMRQALRPHRNRPWAARLLARSEPR